MFRLKRLIISKKGLTIKSQRQNRKQLKSEKKMYQIFKENDDGK